MQKVKTSPHLQIPSPLPQLPYITSHLVICSSCLFVLRDFSRQWVHAHSSFVYPFHFSFSSLELLTFAQTFAYIAYESSHTIKDGFQKGKMEFYLTDTCTKTSNHVQDLNKKIPVYSSVSLICRQIYIQRFQRINLCPNISKWLCHFWFHYSHLSEIITQLLFVNVPNLRTI